MEVASITEKERREAVSRLEKKRDFKAHALIYAVVNAVLVVIWAVTGEDFFWPVFLILGWGIVVASHAWLLYGHEPPSEDEIRREVELRRELRRG